MHETKYKQTTDRARHLARLYGKDVHSAEFLYELLAMACAVADGMPLHKTQLAYDMMLLHRCKHLPATTVLAESELCQ